MAKYFNWLNIEFCVIAFGLVSDHNMQVSIAWNAAVVIDSVFASYSGFFSRLNTYVNILSFYPVLKPSAVFKNV